MSSSTPPHQNPPTTLEEYFLLEVLQAVSHNRTPEAVYPLLQRNLDKLDIHLGRVLQAWAQVTLPEVELRQRYSIAAVIGNFSKLISHFPLGNRASNIEIAIAGYEVTAEVFTREEFPQGWAMTQNNLGNAYRNRIFGEKRENLEKAIACYTAALTVYTSESFPQDWAMTQNNLGTAYWNRIFGEKGENLEKAIACYQNALQVRTPTALPLECLKTGRNLGDIAFEMENWQLAIQGYSEAIAAVEKSRSWATSDERRQQILAESIDIYANMVQACVNNQQLDKAMEYAERSRCQRLVDLMASKDLAADGEIHPEVEELLQQYRDKQREIDLLRPDLHAVGATRSRVKLQIEDAQIQKLETEKQQLWQQVRRLDPVLSGQIQVTAPNLAAMQQLIDDDKTAILSFYTTTNDTYIFILQKHHLSCHTCPGEGVETLQNWIIENWLTPYVKNKPEWRSKISWVLKELASRLRLHEAIAQHLDGIEELIILPHLYLHQIPFAAMPIDPPSCSQNQSAIDKSDKENNGELYQVSSTDPANISLAPQHPSTPSPLTINVEPNIISAGNLLGDRFLIRYVPSCQVLEFCRNRDLVETPLEYGTVEDATEDLPCANFEGEQIAQLYEIPSDRRYRGRQQATVANYRHLAKQVQGILSTHHATSCLNDPLQSELQLADGSITLAELLTPSWRLPQLVDVFLSCCETGLGLPENLSDDILTISFGFLCAGARNVVSTLWAVDDLATALFSLFYHESKKSLTRPAALRKAQEQLRTLTGETLATQYQPLLLPLLNEKLHQTEAALKQTYTALKQARKQSPALEEHYKKEYNQISKTKVKLVKAKHQLESACKQQVPFSDYFYWSAFTCQGLR